MVNRATEEDSDRSAYWTDACQIHYKFCLDINIFSISWHWLEKWCVSVQGYVMGYYHLNESEMGGMSRGAL